MGADHSVSRSSRPSQRHFASSEEQAKAAKLFIQDPWAEVHHCDLSEWSRGHSVVFGFDHKIDYCVPHLRNNNDVFLQNIQPYCTRGYQFKIEKLEKRERTINRNHGSYRIPEIVTKRSRYMYPIYAPSVSIIGYQRNIAILQVVYKKTKELHFIAIELRSGKHLSVYKDIYISEPGIYEAYLSPDETCYLLRPNFFFAYARCSDPFAAFAITKDIKVISIKTYESKVINIIEDISDLWHSIAFDPRVGHSVIALGNYATDCMENMDHQLALFNIDEMRVLAQSEEYHSTLSHHMVYNPQGTLLVSLGIRLLWPRVDMMYPVKALFFNPNDLTILQVVARDSVSVNHFHASLTPLFSKTGQYMALIGSHGHSISVFKMPQDVSLKHMCRLNILDLVSDDKLTELPLPRKLINYLLFQPQWC